jgi:hypothetical protein
MTWPATVSDGHQEEHAERIVNAFQIIWQLLARVTLAAYHWTDVQYADSFFFAPEPPLLAPLGAANGGSSAQG